MEKIFDPTEKRMLYGVIFALCSMVTAIIDLALFRSIINATKNASDMKLVLVTSFCVLLSMVMASVVVTFQSFPIKVFSIQVAITGYFALLATLGIPLVSDHSRYSAMCIGSVVFATILGMILDFAWGKVCSPKASDGASQLSSENFMIDESNTAVTDHSVECSTRDANNIINLFRGKVITQQECHDRLNAVRAKLGLPPKQFFDLGDLGTK